MAAVSFNTTVEQGSLYEIVFRYTNDNGLPIDISNYCVVMQWLTDTNDVYIFSNRYDGLDYSLQSGADGTITLRIPSRVTNTYTFNSAIYDLDIQEPNESYPGSGLTTYRLATGNVFIAKRATSALQTDCANLSSGFNLQENCDIECGKLDAYSITYNGSGLPITDNSETSNSIITSDSRIIENIELVINGLRHNSPQDLIFILSPPSGDKVLLSANAKISNYRPGFSFMVSNRAIAGNYISNIVSGGLCNILDKTSLIKYNNENLLSSFDHLFGQSVTGTWTLIVIDSDLGISGTIDDWKLIITYEPLE